MAPAHMGKPHFSLQVAITCFKSSPFGMVIYLDFNHLTMAWQTSFTQRLTKDRDTPNKLATERYSAVDAMK